MESTVHFVSCHWIRGSEMVGLSRWVECRLGKVRRNIGGPILKIFALFPFSQKFARFDLLTCGASFKTLAFYEARIKVLCVLKVPF